MGSIKIASWNVEHLDKLVKPNLGSVAKKRRDAIVREINDMAADILCIVEGPKGETAADKISAVLLNGEWLPVKAADGAYATLGTQWIWFFVRKNLVDKASLLPVSIWDAYSSKEWSVNYWGEATADTHKHYRHPQVLVLDWNGFRIEFIGLHCKSKFVNNGRQMWNKGGAERQKFIDEALKARVKMTTEVSNVRAYIDARFNQTEKPAIFVMGDFNDGPGKEYFENQYLFFDLVSNIQGDIFQAHKYLNHGLFDYSNHLRWTVDFKDFVDPGRDPHILLDHIFFTQGLVDGSLPWHVPGHTGKVEHEIHDLINSTLPASAKTSDHKPVSLVVNTQG